MKIETSMLTQDEQDYMNALGKLTGAKLHKLNSIGSVTMRLAALLSNRWEHIVDLGLHDGNGGKVSFSFSVKMNVSGKMPTGTIKLAFAHRTEDETTFAVEDAEQAALLFAEVVASNPATRTRRGRPAAEAGTGATSQVHVTPSPL